MQEITENAKTDDHSAKVAFRRLKRDLQRAFTEPDTAFETVTLKDIIARNPPRA
ncbi:MAG TPA: hypothetical protein PKE65_00370 [Rhizobiaceae bacterium]|nr:hypothetical protein [Rhizobiaceae bacterium]